jgi:hypothetical protein
MANEVKEQTVEQNPNEFEFSKQRRILAMYAGDVISKIVLNDLNLTASIQWIWGNPKGKSKSTTWKDKKKRITLDYHNIEKVEIKAGFSKSSIINSAVCAILGLAMIPVGGAAVLLLIPLFLFIGFGTNIIISCKDKTKVSFMTGKLDGDTRQNFCDKLDKKFTSLQGIK